MEINIDFVNGTELKGWIIKPEAGAKKVIIFVHGIGEHSGRYEEWAKRFVEKGYAVIGFDLPGHGRSPGKRGHIRKFSEINRLIDRIVGLSNEWFPGIPVVLYGQSMGGLIVLNYLSLNGGNIEQSIATSPWLRLSFEPPESKIRLAKIAKSIFPSFTQKTGLVTEHLVSNEELIEKYREDPLVHGMISASLFYEAYSTGERLMSLGDGFTPRVLIMHGEADKITSPQASGEFAGSAPNATFRLWKDGFHELHNESFCDEVFEFIVNWLEEFDK